MQRENQRELTGVHLRVWTALTNLQEGERIVGRELMESSGLTNERQFHGVIESLRSADYPIGASKGLHNPGYYRITNDRDAWNYHFQTVQSLEREVEWLTDNTETFFLDKYGASFDFLAAKNKEELSRFGKENK